MKSVGAVAAAQGRFLTRHNLVTGTIPKLPGNNPVQNAGVHATMFVESVKPAILSPVYAYTGSSPPAAGSIVSRHNNVAQDFSAETPSAGVSNPISIKDRNRRSIRKRALHHAHDAIRRFTQPRAHVF